jgi:arabinogalactan endo-1,4-beta-galactosidase
MVTLIAICMTPLVQAAPSTRPFHRSGPFLIGADISWAQEDEANGTVFFEHGNQRDIFQILKDHGFNATRLRVFVNPDAPKGYAVARRMPEWRC